ncbi:MAG: hypothetical protein OHK0021_15950 [Bryobacter sp.]
MVPRASSPSRQKPLREILAGLPPPALADWVLTVARDLPEFRQRLEFFAALETDPDHCFSLLDIAFTEFTEFTTRPANSLRVGEIAPYAAFLLQSTECLLRKERLLDALQACARAALLLDAIIARLPNLSVRLQRLLDAFANLHLRIAQQRPLDPASLAEHLYDLQFASPHEFLLNAIAGYAPLLGETGLKAYRRRLQPAYRALVLGEPLPARGGPTFQEHLREAKLLRAWANFTSDFQERFAIAMAFATNPAEVLAVAERMEQAGHARAAADAVLAACDRFHTPPPTTLFAYLAAHFEREANFERSLEFRWELYRALPNESHYRKLLAAAAPLRQTNAVREEAIEYAAAKSNSLYTRILLLEGRRVEAYEQARAQGATTEVWAQIANSYSDSDPHTAIHLYFDCARYSLRTLRGDCYDRSSRFLAEAFKLANDVQTFQTFSVRLKNFFSQNNCPPRFERAIEGFGVPLTQILKN